MFTKWMGILSKSLIFTNINQSDLAELLKCLQPRLKSFKKDELIAVEGEESEGLGVLLLGKVSIIKESIDGNRNIMTMLKPGDIFGEMTTFSDQKKWPATVQAMEACELFFLSPDKIISSCDSVCSFHRTLVVNMLRITTNKALMLNRKVEYLLIRSLRGKISRFLLENFKKNTKTTFMITMKRNELADFLNITRPSLSREMCKMRDEGLIDFHLNSVKILDMEGLKRGL